MKSFQFNPADYNTDYNTIKNLHYGAVVSLGQNVSIEYRNDQDLINLFAMIANTKNHPTIPAPPVSAQNKYDKPIALILLPFLIAYLIWLFFF